MKKISLIDLLLVFLVLAVIGLTVFLFFLLRKPLSNSKSTPIFIPTTSLFGKVSEIKGDSIFFIPDTESLSLLKKTGKPNNNIYEAKLKKNTLMTKTYSIPYISPEVRPITKPVNILSNEILPNDRLSIETNSDLSQLPKETIIANTITIYSNPFFVPGTIENIKGDSIEITTPPVGKNPSEEIVKELNIKKLQVLIAPKTELGYKSASVSGLIKKEELSVGNVVFIFSYDNPDTNNTITAETVTVQRF